MDWIELAVAADPEAVEAVADRLRKVGQGVALDVPFTQASPYDDPVEDPTRPVIVKTYVRDDPDVPRIWQEVERDLWHIGRLRSVEPLPMRRIAEEDWATAWKEFFPIVAVGKSFVIVPAWKRYARNPDQIAIRLDPGMAFGTGTHPTTRLCLCAIESLVHRGTKVLDVGTGSGILAIAAALRGAERVIGLDIDPLAISAARANVRLNRLGRLVRVYSAGPDAPGAWRRCAPFDRVLANITSRENSRLAASFAGLMGRESRLIASGILTRDAEAVVAAFRVAGLEVCARQEEGDWTALVARQGLEPYAGR